MPRRTQAAVSPEPTEGRRAPLDLVRDDVAVAQSPWSVRPREVGVNGGVAGSTVEHTGSLADRVSAWLAEQIAAGHLRPGQWVSENELAGLLGVSRSPVREALGALARDRIVEVRRRRGTMIAELSADEVDDLFRTRQLVEGELAALAVEHLTEQDLASLEALARAAGEADGDYQALHDASWRAFELVRVRCSSATVADLAANLQRRTIPYRGIMLRLPGSDEQIRRFWERFVRACRKGDRDGAKAAMTEMLEDTRHALLEHAFIEVGEGRRMPRQLVQRAGR